MTTRTCDDWKALLAAAEAARDGLLTGGSIVRVRDGPAEVEYAKTDLPSLQRLILDYQRQVDLVCGTTTCGFARRIFRLTPGSSSGC